MISVLICNCPNAPTKAYRFLQPIVENWMDVPVYKGREKINRFLANFEEIPKDLQEFFNNSSKYIIFAGWDNNQFEWADIAHGIETERMRAEGIIYRFA